MTDTFTPDANRRKALTGAAAALLAFSLPSAGHSAPRTDWHRDIAERARKIAGGEARTLRLLMPEGCRDNLTPLIAVFRQMSGITVESVEAPVDDINTRLMLDSLSGNDGFDLALPATFGLADLVAAEAIVSLSQWVQRHEAPGFCDSELFTIGDDFNDERYGYQADGDTYLMFYHRDLLEDGEEQARYADRFGEPLKVPDTWQELDRQMAWFHRPEKQRYGGLLFRTPGYLAWEWWVRFHAKGYWPLSGTLEPQIAGEAGVEALEEMIRATQYLAPEVNGLGLFDNWDRFCQGDTYCNIGWGGSQKYFNSHGSALRGRLAYGPTPGGMVDGELLLTPYFNWGWSYVVTANSQQPELAYLFALFASTPEMSTLSVRQSGGFFDPHRLEHYEDKGIQETYSEDFLRVHRQSLENSIPDLYLANRGRYFQSLDKWLGRALDGKVSAEVALSNVAERWQMINRRTGKSLQRERWLKLRAKYPASVRTRLRDIG